MRVALQTYQLIKDTPLGEKHRVMASVHDHQPGPCNDNPIGVAEGSEGRLVLEGGPVVRHGKQQMWLHPFQWQGVAPPANTIQTIKSGSENVEVRNSDGRFPAYVLGCRGWDLRVKH